MEIDVPTFIERAAMSADPEEEDVLMSDFDSFLDAPPLCLAIEEMMTMDLAADLTEIKKYAEPTPFTPEIIEELFTTDNVNFSKKADGVWQLTYKEQSYDVTFYPSIFEEKPSLRLMNFGDPLFEELLFTINNKFEL